MAESEQVVAPQPIPEAEIARFTAVLEKAREFDIRPVVRRYMNKRGVSLDRALAISDEMLRYLSLCAVEPNSEWTITGEVDEMWHTFVLFTQRYADFCQAICGKFIHHVPGEEQFVPSDSDSRTVEDILGVGEVEGLVQPEQLLTQATALSLPMQAEVWPKTKKVGWAAVCKPALDPGTLKLGASYADTLKKYHQYLGVEPNSNFWPSPDVLGKPQAPQACGACGGGGPKPHQLCGCGPIKN